MLIERMHVLKPSKRAHEHEQGAFRQMEIGDEHVHYLKIKPRGYKNLRVTASLARL